MAVEDKYVNDEREALGIANAVNLYGAHTSKAIGSEEIAAADDDGSVYRYFTVPANWIPLAITAAHDAITGGTDYDCGLYLSRSGAAKDADVFANGVDISSASRTTDMLQTVDVADLTKKMFEHAGDTEDAKRGEYDLALTANTVGTAAGTVTLILEAVEG